MKSNNETCVQRTIFRFYYLKSVDCKRKGGKLFTLHSTGPKTDPGKVRSLKRFLETRLERIAQMMEILLKAHDDWAITERKDCFQMETLSFDFNDAVRLLGDQGFIKKEYILEVEYTRKWGVL